MKIYRPIKTDKLAQKFGDNNACCKTVNGVPVRPFQIVTKTGLTCPASHISFYPAIGLRGHNGMDFASYRGEPVYFNVDADTKWYAKTEVDADGGVGLRVYSLNPLPFTREELPREMTGHSMSYYNGEVSDGNPAGTLRVCFLYWHLKDVNLSDKPKIQIGTFSDGRPELAPEIKFGDLIAFANSTGASSGDHVHHSMKFCNKSSMTIGSDNGYTGAVDTERFYENTFIGDIIEVEKKAMAVIKLAQNIIAEVVAFLRGRFNR